MNERAIPPVRYTRAADGTSIAYMVWPGIEPPFLRIRSPGVFPMALEAQSPFMRERSARFAANRALVEYDWRGSGQSDRKIPTSLDDLAMDLAAVTEVLGNVPDVVAINASCLPAASFAALNPSAWRSLLLTDPMVQFERSPLGTLLRPGWEEDYLGLLLSLVRSFHRWASFRECETLAREWAEAVPKESHQAYLSLLASVDLTEALRALRIPALVLKVHPRSSAANVAALIPDSVLVEFDDYPIDARGRRLWDTHMGSRFSAPIATFVGSTASLSVREREVLAALAAGQSNGEIAAALTVSIRTVERHVRNIYTKIGVHNRVEATNWARQHAML